MLRLIPHHITPVLLLSWAPFGYSAEALIIGEGQVESAPDYVELSIQVQSQCYPTAEDARKINDTAAKKIVDFLNSKIKKKDSYNFVASSGGYTLPFQYYYQNKYLCQNTFQKQNTITLRTQDLAHFEGLFAEIQQTVYQQFSRNAPTVVESSISFVTMSEPLPGISNELRSKLEKNALGVAFKDASAKLAALFENKKIENLKMIYASELPPPEPKPFFQSSGAPMMMGARVAKSEEAPPVQFAQQNINKVIYFKFTFDDIVLSEP